VLRDKAVVFLFMHGGPAQIETFDPKMSAPVEIRSVTGEVKTAIPGVTFGGTFPKLAERAKRLAIVRSFSFDGRRRSRPPAARRQGIARRQSGLGLCQRRRR
jgi:hypothetical protein